MADRDADGFERRLAPFRGRLAFARAAEDAQAGLAAGAGVFLALGILRWTDLLAVDPLRAAAAGSDQSTTISERVSNSTIATCAPSSALTTLASERTRM